MVYCTLEEAFSKPNITKEKINCNKNKSRYDNYDGLELMNNSTNSVETFENYNPGEMFEYSKSNNRIIPEDSNIEDMIESVSEDDLLNTTIKNKKKNKNSKKKNEINDNNLNPQINEINTKINFLIDHIETKDDSDNNSLDNNIHDIILFILFGIFVIIILEGLFKLVNKIYKHNLMNNLY
tara:strand:+ start:992 stop:1534 length:543 start_codon:yes stop_codon:yes gene_type:complete